MADDIVIDKQAFHERLGNFITKWKADKRSGDAIFQGAGSIATVVGKASEPGSYLKPAAFQVSLAPCVSRSSIGDHTQAQGACADDMCTAMAARLRIPRDPLHPHARPPADCHHQKEG